MCISHDNSRRHLICELVSLHRLSRSHCELTCSLYPHDHAASPPAHSSRRDYHVLLHSSACKILNHLRTIVLSLGSKIIPTAKKFRWRRRRQGRPQEFLVVKHVTNIRGVLEIMALSLYLCSHMFTPNIYWLCTEVKGHTWNYPNHSKFNWMSNWRFSNVTVGRNFTTLWTDTWRFRIGVYIHLL